jgi:hypothetical protein
MTTRKARANAEAGSKMQIPRGNDRKKGKGKSNRNSKSNSKSKSNGKS